MVAPKISAVYQPRGKAKEYAPLAVNLYRGCSHGCIYCYAPACIFVSQTEFIRARPRAVLPQLEADASKLEELHTTDSVLLCFTCDPYQPIDTKYELSRKAITTLHSHHLGVTILTKGGKRAERDLDLLTNSDWFGVTLTNLDRNLSLQWEPGAALPEDRVSSLKAAHDRGVKTWVSLEPVLYPEVALQIIRQTHTFVDKFKVGKLNYHPHARAINWHQFADDVNGLLGKLGCDYYLKEDLRKFLKRDRPPDQRTSQSDGVILSNIPAP